jgi:hypothetical protein
MSEEAQLKEQILFLRLTKIGSDALRDWVPEGNAFSALVVSEKGYGIWVVPQELGGELRDSRDDKVVMIRWDYLAGAMFMRRRIEDEMKMLPPRPPKR